jgi:hypothetical protein
MNAIRTDENDKRVDYLKYINTFGIGVVTLLAGYMSMDIRDIKTAQQSQAVEIMRLDTNQKTVFKSLEVMNASVERLGENDQEMKIEWLKAINELNQKIRK